MFDLDAIYPVTALQKKQPEVREAAKRGLVRITEKGSGAYVFASEEVFRKIIDEIREDAVYEAMMAASIERARDDYENGRYTVGLDKSFKKLAEEMGYASHRDSDA